MTYRNDLDAAHARIEALEQEKRAFAGESRAVHARIEALERENLALMNTLEQARPPVVAAPLAMQPIRRLPFDLGHFLDAVRLAIFLFILLHVLAG